MSDDGDDPFEELDDAVGDREGDPFETLDGDPEAPPGNRSEQPDRFGPDRREPDTEQFRERVDREEPPTEEAEMEFGVGRRGDGDPTREEFLSDAGQREGDPFESFDEMDVDKLDPDIVWQELVSAESRGSVGDAQQRTYADVSKHSYCEGCEYFSPPPDVFCGHEGTEIVEFLNMETVRVVDCPVVTEREKLEEDDGFGDA